MDVHLPGIGCLQREFKVLILLLELYGRDSKFVYFTFICHKLHSQQFIVILIVLSLQKDNSLCKRLTLCDYPNAPFIPVDVWNM